MATEDVSNFLKKWLRSTALGTVTSYITLPQIPFPSVISDI